MRALLFFPQAYSITDMLKDGFDGNGWEAIVADYQCLLSHRFNRLYEKTAGLPNRLTKYWKPAYYNLINEKYLELFTYIKPQVVVIYNNQYFFPETIEKIEKYSKIVFILGDNPLWSTTFDYNLAILKTADLVISADSHWQYELSSIGIPNVICDYIGYSSKRFFPTNKNKDQIKSKYSSDILFIGRNYKDASGYKRSLFFNSFAGMNLKIFGSREWLRWLPYFPDLEPHFNLQIKRVSHQELNDAMNCTKVYPIDHNTGIVNGIHLRVFEVIGAGTLPIVEWRKDLDMVFKKLLPVIKKYNEASEVTEYFLANEQIRKDTVGALRAHVAENYTPMLYVKRLIDRLSL